MVDIRNMMATCWKRQRLCQITFEQQYRSIHADPMYDIPTTTASRPLRISWTLHGITQHALHPCRLQPLVTSDDEEELPGAVAELLENGGSLGPSFWPLGTHATIYLTCHCVLGKELDSMSTFFIEHLRLKDPVKSVNHVGTFAVVGSSLHSLMLLFRG